MRQLNHLKNKKILFIVVLVLLGIFFVFQFPKLGGELPNNPNPDESQVVYPDKVEEGALIFESTISDQTAFDLLKDRAEIEYKEYDFGVMIESINGKSADEDHYWALYVNGEYAQQGADQTMLGVDDIVEWRFEEIKAF